MGNFVSLAISIGIPLAGGIGGGLITAKEIKGWYKKLKKPSWNPPNWIFGPMWTTLYVSMGVASWLVWKVGGNATRLPLALYAAQLAVNFAWTPLFFKVHRLDLALVNIVGMVGLATAATVEMAKVAGPAKILPLMVPYLCWISFATALNADLLIRNPGADKIEGEAKKE